jgi:hypothetical protein
MTNTNLETNRPRTAGASRPAAEHRQPRLLTATETRRSFTTTELWLALAMAVVLIVVGYADDDGLGVNLAWALASGVVGLYILSRGIAKAGSSDPQVRDLDELT